MASDSVNISPDPKILEAISHNPISPIDALCELIDNSIDGFSSAKEQGIEISDPTITISLPTTKELELATGKVRIEDNGPGMSIDQAKNAVTAGFSGNPNQFDRLGLFGMGFNISTGKVGQITEFATTRDYDETYGSLTIDIPRMIREKTFKVPIKTKVKNNRRTSGTIVEVSSWWPLGHMNHGFILKLCRMTKSNLREQVGRRYSTLLSRDLTILIDNEKCPVFRHCPWTEKRFVMRQRYGKIPAKMPLDVLLGVDYRCSKCSTLLDEAQDQCINPNCKSKSKKRAIERRLKGWVGIQRFDDDQQFGIDLIRNGRAIRVLEKQAFFNWTSEDGQQITDYPIDNPYGRIIGEIHMDHVPVDYLKTDFQRTSPEWQEAVSYLRGDTSLQPERAKGENDSPVFMLYQGYRRVRSIGRGDLYMGYWDEGKGAPTRISRSVEKEFYDKFKQNLPGYGYNDDEEWYKQVLAADDRPIDGVIDCPNCGLQNSKAAETCQSCGYIFKPKTCTKCDAEIPLSSVTCPTCGADQELKEDHPWICRNCGVKNPPDTKECRKCKKEKGAIETLTLPGLLERSNLVDDLSIASIAVPLPMGEVMPAIKLSVYFLNPNEHMEKGGSGLPVFTHITSQEIGVFIDQAHPGLTQFQDRPEDYVAIEIARWIRESFQSKINDENRPLWSLSNLYYLIHNNVWKERTELNSAETQRNIDLMLKDISEKLPELLGDMAKEIDEGYDADEKSRIFKQIASSGLSSSQYNELIDSGEYLRYMPYDLMVQLIEKYPHKFFDGKLWKDAYLSLEKTLPDAATLEEVQRGIVNRYASELSDIINYKNYRLPDLFYTQKINLSLQIIQSKIVKPQ
ncbi:MAG: ATP-binding protein [Candidatus Saccharimonadales bacterium]